MNDEFNATKMTC